MVPGVSRINCEVSISVDLWAMEHSLGCETVVDIVVDGRRRAIADGRFTGGGKALGGWAKNYHFKVSWSSQIGSKSWPLNMNR